MVMVMMMKSEHLLLQCMWCESKSACLHYPGGIPSSDFCALSSLRWTTCYGEYI